MSVDAAVLSRGLAQRAPELARELLPDGRRDGQEWRCGSLAGERGQSLAIHLSGARAGVWSDFASGERGDALDLVAAVLYRGDRRQAMAWARRWLGLGDGQAPATQPRPIPPQRSAPADDADALARQRAAQYLFLNAAPSLSGTPADAYLKGRGIDLADLQRQPRCLRYHPALSNRESGRDWPALVAAVTNADGEHVATHRTWLHEPQPGVWRKAPLENPKMSLGRVAGGSIRLWRGASGKSLVKAPPGETVVLAEGIETALSVAIACPDMRVLATVSLGNMGRLSLPPAITTIILAADNDVGNPPAQRALAAAAERYADEGRLVKIAMPEAVGTDWNDVLVGAVA